MKEEWFADITDALVEQRSQDEGKAKAMEEKVRIMKNKEQHINLIKKTYQRSAAANLWQTVGFEWTKLYATINDKEKKQMIKSTKKGKISEVR
jgi:hypothetical protein